MLNCSPSFKSSMITLDSSWLMPDRLLWERLPWSDLNEILVGFFKRHFSMKSLLCWMSPEMPQRKTEPSVRTHPLCERPQAIVLMPTPIRPVSSLPLKYSTCLNWLQESLFLWPRAKVLPLPQEKMRWRLDLAKVWIEPHAIWSIRSFSLRRS